MAEQGKYLTSFLEICVNTEKELNNLALLDSGELGTYYHEYFHYIQDITTHYGLSKIWQSFDRFRQLVASIQSSHDDYVYIPLEGPAVDEQLSHMQLLEIMKGSGQINGISPDVADAYKISHVEYSEDAHIGKYFPEHMSAKVTLHLVQDGMIDRHFIFGEAAISESMAYLIERKFFPELNKLPRYPYKVAHELVEFIYPKLLANEENLFALCDMSLMHTMPGWAFVEILNEMKKKGISPQTGEEVITFAHEFYNAQGWNFKAYMKKSDESLQKISEQLFGNPQLKPTLDLFQALIERGRLLRENCPFAILGIYKAEISLSHNFYKVFNFLGGPHAVNANGLRFLRAPNGLEYLNETAHPQYFRVIWQLNKFFLKDIRTCSLYQMCSAPGSNVPVDDRCDYAPWKRTEDELGCPYAVFWTMYGFHLKDFYSNGVLLQEKMQDQPGT